MRYTRFIALSFALAVTGVSFAATLPSSYTVYLVNDTAYPVTIGIGLQNQTPLQIKTKIIQPGKTTAALVGQIEGVGKTAPGKADSQFYAKVGSTRGYFTTPVFHYQYNVNKQYAIGFSPSVIKINGKVKYHVGAAFPLPLAPNITIAIEP